VRSWRQTNYEKACRRVAEAGDRTSPVDLFSEGLALFPADPLAVLSKPGAELARDDALAHHFEPGSVGIAHLESSRIPLKSGIRRDPTAKAIGTDWKSAGMYVKSDDVVRIRDWSRDRRSLP
jgi:hypothetical protein